MNHDHPNIGHTHKHFHTQSGIGKAGHGDHSHHDHAAMIRDYWRRFIVSLTLTFPIIILSPSLQSFIGFSVEFPGRLVILWILSTIVYIYGGKPFLVGLVREVRMKLPGMMTLIGVAISVAYIYSSLVTFLITGKTFFWELATLIDVMLIGHWIEMKSILGASKAVEKLVKAMPSTAHLVGDDGSIIEVHVSRIKNGDKILVKPGEKIPVDGVVVEGSSSVDESLVTGESKQVYKTTGSKVIAGTVNLDGSLIVEATAVRKDTYLSQVVELIKNIQASRSRLQDLAGRVAKWLTITALTVGSITFIVWFLYMGDIVFALERAVTVMVITCPHALGLAIPLVVSRSTAITASGGVLIRNRSVFERAYRIDTIVIDKTGTLTKGKPVVVDVVAVMEGVDVRDIIQYAVSIEKHSSHPLAEAIVKHAEEQGVKPLNVTSFKNIPGIGVEGFINGSRIVIASPKYIEERTGDLPAATRKYIDEGYTIAYVLMNDELIGAIILDDEVREESRIAVRELKKRGIRVVMLTGDAENVARRVAGELGIDEYYAEVLPHEKAGVVHKLRMNNRIVAMVGDGVNDAPALIEADVGIAIGAGTDIAIESADIILVKNDPRDIVSAIDLSAKTYRKIKQNLLWAVGYNVFAIPAAAGALYFLGFLLPPAIGALLMSASTVIVAVNASTIK